MRIAVSIGHTLYGADTGAVGYLNESKCNREVGNLVVDKLEAQGHEVVLCQIDNATDVNISLNYRVNKANSTNCDLFIEIHFNAGGGTGSETWIIGTGGTAEKYARDIVNSICEIGYPNRGVKVGNLYVLKNTVAPAVLIECCFVDSKADADRYNADELASKIVKGITGVDDMGTPNSELNCTHYALEDCVVVDSNNEYVGMIYKNEEFQVNWVGDAESNYIKSVDFAGSNGYTKSGYLDNKYNVCKIGEEPPKEETKEEYKVVINCKSLEEANLIKTFLATARVE